MLCRNNTTGIQERGGTGSRDVVRQQSYDLRRQQKPGLIKTESQSRATKLSVKDLGVDAEPQDQEEASYRLPYMPAPADRELCVEDSLAKPPGERSAEAKQQEGRHERRSAAMSDTIQRLTVGDSPEGSSVSDFIATSKRQGHSKTQSKNSKFVVADRSESRQERSASGETHGPGPYVSALTKSYQERAGEGKIGCFDLGFGMQAKSSGVRQPGGEPGQSRDGEDPGLPKSGHAAQHRTELLTSAELASQQNRMGKIELFQHQNNDR